MEDLNLPDGFQSILKPKHIPHSVHRLIKKIDINPSRRYVLISTAIPRTSEETAKRKERGDRENTR